MPMRLLDLTPQGPRADAYPSCARALGYRTPDAPVLVASGIVRSLMAVYTDILTRWCRGYVLWEWAVRTGWHLYYPRVRKWLWLFSLWLLAQRAHHSIQPLAWMSWTCIWLVSMPRRCLCRRERIRLHEPWRKCVASRSSNSRQRLSPQQVSSPSYGEAHAHAGRHGVTQPTSGLSAAYVGTTSRPKNVLLTHANICTAAHNMPSHSRTC